MGFPVTSGATLTCSFGAAPSTLIATGASGVKVEKRPVATIMDFTPNSCIMPFGVCSSLSNPQTASLTAAALGVLTPAPCVPMTTTPWTPGQPITKFGKLTALTDSSMCNCMYGGVIQVTVPGPMFTSLS